MSDNHCRIGKIKFKNGAEMRVLPSAKERMTDKTFKSLDWSLGHVRRLYGKDFGGYTLAVWQADGSYNVFICALADNPTRNNLPVWIAEAVRRDNGEYDCDRLIKYRMGIED